MCTECSGAGSANTAVPSSAILSGTSFPSTKVWGLLKDTGGSTQINDHKAAKAGSEARGVPSSEEEYKENFPHGNGGAPGEGKQKETLFKKTTNLEALSGMSSGGDLRGYQMKQRSSSQGVYITCGVRRTPSACWLLPSACLAPNPPL